jgi:hypothetical protein
MLELMPCAGLANRMRAIASAAAAAELLERGLRIGWKVDPGIQTAAFRDLFDATALPPWIGIVELGRNPGLWNEAPEANSETDWELFLAANAASPVITFKSWAAFFEPNTVAWLRHLRSLRPAATISAAVDDILSSVPEGTPLVGIHIRRTDHRRSIIHSPSYIFWQAMRAALATDPATMFYIASDDERERATAKNYFGAKVICGPATLPGRSTVEGCQGALVDLLCLSRCDRILGSTGSSFSEIAAAYGGCPLEVLREQ